VWASASLSRTWTCEYTPRGELPKLLGEFKSQYPFLNLDDVQFRLFRTKHLGEGEKPAGVAAGVR